VKGRPLVFEVNSSPSIREPEAACGVDLAARIVDRAISVAEAHAPPARAAPGRPAAGPT
jgi:glutathione synthase/RimK-type ligase-like ATP-grasp enzyme